MGKDFYCDSVEDIPIGQYIGLKRDQLALESLEQVDGKAIPTNILRMLLKDDNHELTSNFPNYIKELSYTKS
jgi:hypothetical protein